jgi:hypothetical protein
MPEQINIEKQLKGDIQDLFKGGVNMQQMDSSRIAVGLDMMLGKRTDIASRIVAS